MSAARNFMWNQRETSYSESFHGMWSPVVNDLLFRRRVFGVANGHIHVCQKKPSEFMTNIYQHIIRQLFLPELSNFLAVSNVAKEWMNRSLHNKLLIPNFYS